MRPLLLVPLALALSTLPAAATATLNCSAKDRQVTFQADAAVSRGVGEGFPNFGGTLEIKAPSVPADMRKVSFEQQDLTQRWLYGRDVKLRLYWERAGSPHGTLEFVLEGKSLGETDFAGSYVLTVYFLKDAADNEGKTLKFRGKAFCSAG